MVHALFQDIHWDLGQHCCLHFVVEWRMVRTLFLPSLRHTGERDAQMLSLYHVCLAIVNPKIAKR
jgi:hypothetical protein